MTVGQHPNPPAVCYVLFSSLDSDLVATRYVVLQTRMHLSAYMARARIVGGRSKREG